MFGLFDKPATKIRKNLPANSLDAFDKFAAQLDVLPDLDYLQPEQRKHLSIGFILSVWACNSAHAGVIHLNQRQLMYIQNMGVNCYKMLGTGTGTVERVLDALIEHGYVPKQDSETLHVDTPDKENEANEERSRTEVESNLIGMYKPLHKNEYLSKYQMSEEKLKDAISKGKIKAAWEGGNLWVEDRRA